jgi:hypothetical protein
MMVNSLIVLVGLVAGSDCQLPIFPLFFLELCVMCLVVWNSP